MHGRKPEEIKALHWDMLYMATWPDFTAWNRHWRFRDRVYWRCRFLLSAFLREFGKAYRYIP
jgi:hypothetical protein